MEVTFMKYMKIPKFKEIVQQGYVMVSKLFVSYMYFGELH